jgi:hypothetical protein
MASPDRKSDRPALKSTEVYRPRLGTQREPLSRTTMSEIRAWREASAQTANADPEGPRQTA